MESSKPYPISPQRLLHPMMWICALALIVFSFVGIASTSGWMPQGVESGTSEIATTNERAPPLDTANPDAQTQKSVPAFQCAECSVIDSVRDIERRGALLSAPIATAMTELDKAAAAL